MKHNVTIVASKTFPCSAGLVDQGSKVVLPSDEAEAFVAGGCARYVKVMSPVEKKPGPVHPSKQSKTKPKKVVNDDQDRKDAQGHSALEKK